MRFITLLELPDHPNLTGAWDRLRGWLRERADVRKDKRFAKRESRKALRAYQCVHAARPDLQGRDLYEEIVAKCAVDQRETALAYVRHAVDSFAAWPANREVRFRDVVAYIIFDELVLSKQRPGTRADIEAVVASIVPANF
jgi:hypothetical protein